MNYKNKKTGQIISSSCYNKLNYIEQGNWQTCYDEPTHSYDHENSSDDNFLFNTIATVAAVEIMDSVLSSSNDSYISDIPSSDSSSDFSFGGGDTSGGGAGGDW